ncbi:MAG: hypothetical protein ACYC91_18550 [Solirubrobacteraceae bacterium]
MTFLILYVALGLPLWISFLAAGAGALVASGLALVGAAQPKGAMSSGLRLNPTLEVSSLRTRFLLTVALALLGGFISGQVVSFGLTTSRGISFATGIAAVAMGLVLSPTLRRAHSKQVITLTSGARVVAWDIVAVLTTAIGAWQIVESRVFAASTGDRARGAFDRSYPGWTIGRGG